MRGLLFRCHNRAAIYTKRSVDPPPRQAFILRKCSDVVDIALMFVGGRFQKPKSYQSRPKGRLK
jgi:hypothetical protein